MNRTTYIVMALVVITIVMPVLSSAGANADSYTYLYVENGQVVKIAYAYGQTDDTYAESWSEGKGGNPDAFADSGAWQDSVSDDQISQAWSNAKGDTSRTHSKSYAKDAATGYAESGADSIASGNAVTSGSTYAYVIHDTPNAHVTANSVSDAHAKGTKTTKTISYGYAETYYSQATDKINAGSSLIASGSLGSSSSFNDGTIDKWDTPTQTYRSTKIEQWGGTGEQKIDTNSYASSSWKK